jgi:glycerophosphoryl diester phosphodiesterase
MAAVTALTGLTALVTACGGGTPQASPTPGTPGDARTGAQGAFDLEAHRGGAGLTVESTLAAFGRAMEVGVTTLELDTQITRDGRAVVTHDARVDGRTCRDTGPATPGDPSYPYVGKLVHGLDLAQVRTLDCGSRPLPAFPGQRTSPGARIPLLSEVFALARARSARSLRFDIETKIDADAPRTTASREQFVQVLAADIRAAGVGDRVSIESFDWGSLMRMRKVAPGLRLVALTDRKNLEVGRPGASPWLGGIDIDDFGGDVVAAAHSFGADAVSPVHGFPSSATADDPSYRPYVTAAMVRRAHRLGMAVVPWTVDDEPTMRALVADGVDGLITNYPDRLRRVLHARGWPLPPAYAAR